MCEGCWNVKTFEAKKRNGENCNGEIEKISIDELKKSLIDEWLKTSQTNFNVFKQALNDVIFDELSFETSALINGSVQHAQLHVHLV